MVKSGCKNAKLFLTEPYASIPERSLGLLKDRAECIIHDDFEIIVHFI